MRWLIKNPAPSDSRRTKWGDYHFGRSLTKYLERLGHDVQTQYDPHWDEDASCDVVLVLRGKYASPPADVHAGALRVMWNISHPDDVELDEYESYDMVFVASRTLADSLGSMLHTPVLPLLQCTDLEEFGPPSDVDGPRTDIIFIGNTRDVERPGVLWAIDYGIRLKIWGRGWSDWSAGEYVVDDYFPNEDLGQLYARSRATLNDHWDDMKKYGFINNRIFDALACGLPVVSDWHDELHAMFPTGILYYRDRSEFDSCMEELLLNYPHVQREVTSASAMVRERFSFQQRAQVLAETVEATLLS
ncbi:MAG TPA: glycosyltransferase [Acidimicrobiia bacterium]|nr:glycosyltransferase [Acidimicrobiia bacterium]